MKIRSIAILLASILTIGMLATGCGSKPAEQANQPAKPMTFKIALAANTGSALGKDLQEFKRLVESKSNGRIKVETFPDSQLGSEIANQQSLQAGALQMACISSSLPTIVPQLDIFDLPYLVMNRNQIEKLIASPVMGEIQKMIEAKGLVLIGFTENGFRHITNNKRPIVKPEDLAGLKIRTPNAPSRLLTFKALKANPTPIPFSELFQALQQGVVDGQENPLSQIEGSRMYEAQKYLSLSGHVYTPMYFLAAKPWWDGLHPDDKKLLLEAGKELGVFSRKQGEKNDKELVEVLKQKGMAVNNTDFKAFRQATGEVWNEMSKKIGPDFVQRVTKGLGE